MYERKKLNYELDELEPYIDKETMNEHYNVHYKKYTDNLNEELKKLNIQSSDIVELLKQYEVSTSIRNNGGGYYNHFLYFENLCPKGDFNDASDELKEKINRDFQSYYNFKKEFEKAGLEVFGSGWVWLIENNNKLHIAKTKNQDNPIMILDCKVLLGMDVWEHAYYLKHKAERKAYIQDFFKVINWKIVSERL